MSEEHETPQAPISSANFPTSPKVVFVRVSILIVLLISIMVYVSLGEDEDQKSDEFGSSLSVEDILNDDPERLGQQLNIDLDAADD